MADRYDAALFKVGQVGSIEAQNGPGHQSVRNIIDGTSNLTFILIVGSCVGQLLSVYPESRNVSAGTLVQITCATPETELTVFSLTTTPHIDVSDRVVTHPNGGTQHTLSFIAPVKHSSINIVCHAIKGTVNEQKITVLMIQGEPVSVCSYINKISAKLFIYNIVY